MRTRSESALRVASMVPSCCSMTLTSASVRPRMLLQNAGRHTRGRVSQTRSKTREARACARQVDMHGQHARKRLRQEEARAAAHRRGGQGCKQPANSADSSQKRKGDALELLVLALLVPRLEPVALHLQLERLKLVLQLLRSRTTSTPSASNARVEIPC